MNLFKIRQKPLRREEKLVVQKEDFFIKKKKKTVYQSFTCYGWYNSVSFVQPILLPSTPPITNTFPFVNTDCA